MPARVGAAARAGGGGGTVGMGRAARGTGAGGPRGGVGRPAGRERAAGRDWTVAATGFWQIHPAAADALTAAVGQFLAPKPGETALDLYAGVGLFAAAVAPAVPATRPVIAGAAHPAPAGHAPAHPPHPPQVDAPP